MTPYVEAYPEGTTLVPRALVNLVGVEEFATVTPGRTKMVTGGDSES